MKVGIDSYCFHRYFGEVYPYPGHVPLEKNWSTSDFIKEAKELGADGVNLESCFLESLDDHYILDIKSELDSYNLERVIAWGHPTGLERGLNPEAYDEMIRLIPTSKLLGADVMRITGSGAGWRFEDHKEQIARLKPLLKEAAKIAKDNGVRLALENHHDFFADEILEMIEYVDSPYFGANFDSGNFARMLDDPVRAMELLKDYTFSTHLKDLKIDPSMPPNEWCFMACVPIGQGFVQMQKIVDILATTSFDGFIAVEIDYPHPDWTGREYEAVKQSIEGMRNLVKNIK